MAPIRKSLNYYTEKVQYDQIEIQVRRSQRNQNRPKPNYNYTNCRKQKPRVTKHFCEKCNYFHLQKRCNSCENKTTISEPKPVPYYCEKCNEFSSKQECFM